MNVERRPREYFDRFADKPVKIKPFDAASKQESFQYLATLNEILAPLDVLAELFGSTDLEIAGKRRMGVRHLSRRPAVVSGVDPLDQPLRGDLRAFGRVCAL